MRYTHFRYFICVKFKKKIAHTHKKRVTLFNQMRSMFVQYLLVLKLLEDIVENKDLHFEVILLEEHLIFLKNSQKNIKL